MTETKWKASVHRPMDANEKKKKKMDGTVRKKGTTNQQKNKTQNNIKCMRIFSYAETAEHSETCDPKKSVHENNSLSGQKSFCTAHYNLSAHSLSVNKACYKYFCRDSHIPIHLSSLHLSDRTMCCSRSFILIHQMSTSPIFVPLQNWLCWCWSTFYTISFSCRASESIKSLRLSIFIISVSAVYTGSNVFSQPTRVKQALSRLIRELNEMIYHLSIDGLTLLLLIHNNLNDKRIGQISLAWTHFESTIIVAVYWTFTVLWWLKFIRASMINYVCIASAASSVYSFKMHFTDIPYSTEWFDMETSVANFHTLRLLVADRWYGWSHGLWSCSWFDFGWKTAQPKKIENLRCWPMVKCW